MSTLVDWQIVDAVAMQGLVDPFDPALINPASLDVRLGPNILIEGGNDTPDGSRWVNRSLVNCPYRMEPGEFILGATQEFVRVPNTMEAIFQLKSSRGREGFDHALAGYIDPGFHGRITLELRNMNQRHSLTLVNGMLIGQLRFMRLDEEPDRPYSITGRYNMALDVEQSKG
jgi:dCTP deaminase